MPCRHDVDGRIVPMMFILIVISLCLPHLLRAQEAGGVQCQAEIAIPGNDIDICSEYGCFWLLAKEQDGTETGRCYRCSQQTTQAGCEGTGVCIWIEGRKELGGSDCTICAGRTQQDCESTGFCFWDLEGFEGVCSKCPGHTDKDSCSTAGCFWRRVKGVEKCVKCGGFVTKETCEAAACKWNPDANVKCGGNPDIFLLPLGDSSSLTSTLYSSIGLIIVMIASSLLAMF